MPTHLRVPRTPTRRVAPARAVTQERLDRADLTRRLFERRESAAEETVRRDLLEQIVELHLDVASSIASRYRSRGVDADDLDQVASLGLFKAVQRFDVHAGPEFMSFALPTIRGEIQRYFRDHGWMVRPPRRIQELQQSLRSAQTDLERLFGRSPRPGELAAHLDVSTEDVVEAVSARGCFSPSSLDLLTSSDDTPTLYEFLSVDDPGQPAVEARVVLGPLVRELSERDRHVLSLRFFSGWPQSEIATHIGGTQVQVSRLLERILRDLRRGLGEEPDRVLST
ncbi:sigma-70 family RNA polymerase sigma factor [Nocardioides aurantiacus]|uniref:RNA polymerase sigma-28 (SigD/FliA/WhiG) subunit n=1 Tax=Nocardioides aurantiacus TaxID=86796 RepID=A0A3N2CTZ8_9ACTN|nr:sigma-70 family RNA polymerase sigma factor [Nocardioides aurantiacus]ROR91012.1 RNA polymerase sigma-28 (SigD/FliA/WhiG) subunit [Nocardioides aurantiacus]